MDAFHALAAACSSCTSLQIGERRDYQGDLAAQVEQCFLNVGAALAEAGVSFDNVAKLTTFVTDWSTDK